MIRRPQLTQRPDVAPLVGCGNWRALAVFLRLLAPRLFWIDDRSPTWRAGRTVASQCAPSQRQRHRRGQRGRARRGLPPPHAPSLALADAAANCQMTDRNRGCRRRRSRRRQRASRMKRPPRARAARRSRRGRARGRCALPVGARHILELEVGRSHSWRCGRGTFVHADGVDARVRDSMLAED